MTTSTTASGAVTAGVDATANTAFTTKAPAFSPIPPGAKVRFLSIIHVAKPKVMHTR